MMPRINGSGIPAMRLIAETQILGNWNREPVLRRSHA
jgi:hypothetical protein